MTTVGPPQPAGDQRLTEKQLTGQPGAGTGWSGSSPAHHDFVDKVKGALHYAADWRLPGMLHGRIVRSALPSARITGIDVSAARALPGVVAVLTAADVPSNQHRGDGQRRPGRARGEHAGAGRPTGSGTWASRWPSSPP